ncbi:TPA: hypothetical protein ENG04_08890 [Candidatus Poribacteria bacterium]|nr:hypothetical protein [Candidatus Poribacteria bacterium]HEX30181.1 hypothetical protein [Candidatus Poribacteria bacterium]
MFRRRRKKPQSLLTEGERRELIRENMEYARKCAEDGNVSGMEMAIEMVINHSHAINEIVDMMEIKRIKLMGYQRGVEVLNQRIATLREEGKEEEAERLGILMRSYRREALSIKDEMERRERMRRMRREINKR